MGRATRLPVLAFAATICVGTLLLLLPAAHVGPLSPVDALFTATSATCVTGLAVRDTGAGFTRFGQWVILGLIQLGGIGIVTFSSLLAVALRRALPLAGREVVEGRLVAFPRADLRRILKSVVVMMLALEGVGTLALAWVLRGRVPAGDLWFQSLFHAVSAFCNAGFALWSDSLTGLRDSVALNLVVMALIVLGGLGFLCQYELGRYVWSRRRERLSLQTRLVLRVSVLLTLGGALVFHLLERGHGLKQLGPVESVMASLFQSVTTRTAGFNTLPLDGLQAPTLLLMMLLMFVGAAPGSTGGGIKITTFAVVIAAIRAYLRRQDNVNVLHRSLPWPIVASALVVALASSVVLYLGVFGLTLLEVEAHPGHSQSGFLATMFEMTSALGTVGLSMGITAQLTSGSKLLLTVVMFVGRLGPAALAFAFALGGEAKRTSDLQYAEEGVMIG